MSGRSTRALGLCTALMLIASRQAFADAIDDLPPGQWLEVPDSRLDSVGPSPPPPGTHHTPQGVFSYSGAAWDDLRARLLVWGGGHADYAGNELYAFDLNSLRWSRPWGPTPNSDIPACADGCEAYDDGNPAARHTYDGIVYVGMSGTTRVDALYAFGGSRYRNGYGSSHGWRFDVGGSSWTDLADYPGSDMLGNNAVFDPATGHVFVRNNGNIAEYDPVRDEWTVRYPRSGMFWAGSSTVALDPERRLLIFVGGVMGVATFDLTTYEFTERPTTGGDSFIHAPGPGFAYDSATGSMIAWNGGPDVYALDRDSWTWSRLAGSGATAPTPPDGGGTFGRFRYAPSRNVFVLVNAADENVFVYRLSEGGGPAIDAGVPVDAGMAVDAGSRSDAGTGTGDAGMTGMDDAAVDPPVEAAGCHVRSGRGRGLATCLIGALALALRSRRRRVRARAAHGPEATP